MAESWCSRAGSKLKADKRRTYLTELYSSQHVDLISCLPCIFSCGMIIDCRKRGIVPTYGFLMNSLKEWKAVAKDNPDPEHFKTDINMVRDKPNEWTDYPRLSPMALDSLSIPSMSAECKCHFSVAGQMALPLRTRLEAGTIGITQTLRSCVRNGLVDAEDKLIDVSEDMKLASYGKRQVIQTTRWISLTSSTQGIPPCYYMESPSVQSDSCDSYLPGFTILAAFRSVGESFFRATTHRNSASKSGSSSPSFPSPACNTSTCNNSNPTSLSSAWFASTP